MNEAAVLLLSLLWSPFFIQASNLSQNGECNVRFLSSSTTPTRLNYNITPVAETIISDFINYKNLSLISHGILSDHNTSILGILIKTNLDEILALNISGRLKIFPNRTVDTEVFWKAYKLSGVNTNGWGVPFKTCQLPRQTWFYTYFYGTEETKIGLFLKLIPDQCDRKLKEIFNATHQCDEITTYCSREESTTDRSGAYRCKCRKGYYHPKANSSWRGFSGEDIENNRINSTECSPCPEQCDICESNGMCSARSDVYLKTAILCIQLACMAITVILGLVVFKQRKTKAIASGMWTILETILLGIFILYSTVVVRFFEPSVIQCLLEPWAREVGFIICYGAIILKLYRHLIEFRTRKAHRWVVKDTDLLKYLLIMIMSVLAYMAAYTSITLNFLQENYTLISVGKTSEGMHYVACKSLWWDYVTETGELVILIFGIHLSYASRNARTQFHERSFLCAAISIELTVSTLFYTARILVLPELHPDFVLIIYCLRTQLSTTITLLLVFVPKFWYQQKQVRSLGQEYSCRINIDAFKDVNAHGPLTSNNSDVDVGEVTLADMSPDDIRAELKRLYLQLEIFKSKTICRDNPHISKRRGGRKAQHRRFSLQSSAAFL